VDSEKLREYTGLRQSRYATRYAGAYDRETKNAHRILTDKGSLGTSTICNDSNMTPGKECGLDKRTARSCIIFTFHQVSVYQGDAFMSDETGRVYRMQKQN
jgi:hypothetical protein